MSMRNKATKIEKKFIRILCVSGAFFACQKTDNPAPDKAVIEAQRLIQTNKYDSAKVLLDKARMELSKSAQPAPIYEEIVYLTEESKTDKILRNMHEDDYKLLLENKYHKDFFFIRDSLIEEKVNEKLYEKRKSRQALLKIRDEVETVTANPSDLADARKLLESMPQPACAGSGMSIAPDGTVIIRVVCNGNGQSMNGRIEIKNGIVRKII
jgi:hypothetical protein